MLTTLARTLAVLAVLPFSASAEQASTPAAGYVVRVDSGSVYLDLGEGSGALPGQAFTVYKEGEELKHPATGKSLGKIEEEMAAGTIREVMPLYSVGALSSSSSSSGQAAPGMRARLGAKKTAAPALVPPPAASPLETGSRGPNWRSGTFDFQITGMAIADFDGDSKPDTALADDRNVSLYPYPPQKDQALSRFQHPGTAVRILSLEASDLDGNGRAELFVSLYNETFTRFETLVLEVDAQGQWAKKGEFPWVVRAYQDGTGQRILAMQQLVDDKTFPFSTIYPLSWRDGKYSAGKPAIRNKRVDWVYDFTTANLDGTRPAVLSLTSTELLRVQFEKGSWKTSEAYSQTPLRVRWAGRVLAFHPPILARYADNAFGGLFLVKNTAALAGLGQPFGVYNGGVVQRKDWNGVSLSTSWKGELGGYATTIALIPPGDGRPEELAVTVVGSAGKSSIWAFTP